MRQINLGLYLIGSGTGGTGGFRGSMRLGGRTPQACSHFLCFMFFQRAGVRFLLGDSNLWEYIENRLTFDLQLSCQIVNSNLTHPPFYSSAIPVKSSYQPHGYYFFHFEKVYSFVSEDAASSCGSCVSVEPSSSDRSVPVAESAPRPPEGSSAGDSSVTSAAGS